MLTKLRSTKPFGELIRAFEDIADARIDLVPVAILGLLVAAVLIGAARL